MYIYNNTSMYSAVTVRYKLRNFKFEFNLKFKLVIIVKWIVNLLPFENYISGVILTLTRK